MINNPIEVILLATLLVKLIGDSVVLIGILLNGDRSELYPDERSSIVTELVIVISLIYLMLEG